MNIIFHIQGPYIYKSVAATAVCRAIKNRWPESYLIVISDFPDVFLCNPFIDKVYNPLELSYFYQDFIADKECKLFIHDPERESDYLSGKYSLIECWCRLIEIAYNNEQPEIFLSEREVSYMANKIKNDKPLFLLQTNHSVHSNGGQYTWCYDIPAVMAQQIVDHYSHEYQVVHIRGDKQVKLNNVSEFVGDIRGIAALISLSEKQVFIDDFCQHISVAVNKQSVVCWANPMYKQRGYAQHMNVASRNTSNKVDWTRVFLGISSNEQTFPEFPYRDESEVFDISAVSRSINSSNLNNFICNRIWNECNEKSMVAQRLAHLIGHFSFNSVSCILDIGSWHLGQSIEFARIFPFAKIDAFEPVPESYAICNRRRSELPDHLRERIAVHNVALSDKSGEIPFYPVVAELSSVPNIGASSMFPFIEGLNGTPFGQNLVQEQIYVQAITLDSWCKMIGVSHIDILWMDVQGAELLVLKGGVEILRKTKVIMTEVGLKPYYNGHTLKPDIDKMLFELGFVELDTAREINVVGYEANVIYINTRI